MQGLFFIALVSGVLLQFFTKSVGVTGVLGFFGYVVWSVYNEFFIPYAGGGASFWPIDIFFGGPCSCIGAAVGGYVTSKLFEKIPEEK